MTIVSPPDRDVRLPVIPFSHGVAAYHDGYPATFNLYPEDTLAAARFVAGWRAAASVADGEAEDAAVGRPAGLSGDARV